MHNVQQIWQFLWSAGNRRQQELKGEELADHTTNVFCSSNKKAQPAMRCKISLGVTGQRETWPPQARRGYQKAGMTWRKSEIREHRTQSYSGWEGEGGKRASEWLLYVIGYYRFS